MPRAEPRLEAPSPAGHPEAVIPKPPRPSQRERERERGAADHPVARRGRWLELSVEADSEAVEAVSEILGRVAPGGVTVAPGFELVDEGLGARIDPTRPATVRAYVPAREPATGARAAATVAEALGHLQAFGLRPIGNGQNTASPCSRATFA